MLLTRMAQRLLAFRGVHFIVTKFGGRGLRSLSFDGKYSNGRWVFSNEIPDLVQIVEHYSSCGHILALGCGTAPIAGELNPASFQSFLGVDLSSEGIRMAGGRANEKIRFEVGDMMKYQCERNYDVILFSNSFNYVTSWQRRAFLGRLTKSLATNGRIIICLAQPARYAGIFKMIRQKFEVDVDRELQGGGGRVVVFR